MEDAINDRSYMDIFDGCSDPENYIPECFDETEINYDEFDGFKKKLTALKEDLKIFGGQPKHSFYTMQFCTQQFSN